MRWIAAWFILAGLVVLGVGLIQLQGPHDSWVLPATMLVALSALATGVGLLAGWGPARAAGILLSLAGIVAGFVVLAAFVPILDVVAGGELIILPALAFVAIFAACAWALIRGTPAMRGMP